MPIDKQKYIQMFVSETEEHLKIMNDLLLKLEENSSDSTSLNEIFRSAHSVKGMAASMGFDGLASLTHVMEDLFNRLRNSPETVTDGLIELTFEALDYLSSSIKEISAQSTPSVPPNDLINKYKQVLSASSAEDKEAEYEIQIVVDTAEDDREVETKSVLPSDKGKELTVSLKIDPQSALPAARAMVAINGLKPLFTHIISTTPDVSTIGTGNFDNSLIVRGFSNAHIDDFTAKISSFSDISDFSVDFSSIGELTNKDGNEEEERENRTVQNSSIRVNTVHLDSLFNQVGELIVQHSRLITALKLNDYQKLSDGLNRLKNTIDFMYSEVLSVRMMPFSYISPRFRRTVRDITKKTGKTVDFSIIGDDIQLDRSVLEELVDPINHMLRNSVDHGIEFPEKRTASGKNKKGSISINISRSGETILIEICDDGKGINSGRIKDIALKKGYISTREYASISREEALMLCTTPGFSTAEAVSDLSGRGVGMDVVRTKIESIGGHLNIRSTEGKGTTVTLEVPLTVVVISAFLAKDQNSFYAFPVSKVKRTMEINNKNIEMRQGMPHIQSGEDNIKIHRLYSRLTGREKTNFNNKCLPSLIIEKNSKLHAITVDEILGTTEIVIKPLGDPLEHLRQFSGATILGDGSIALIVDTENLI